MEQSPNPLKERQKRLREKARAASLRKRMEEILGATNTPTGYWTLHLRAFEKLKRSKLASVVVELVRNTGLDEKRVPDVYARIFERLKEEEDDVRNSEKTEMTPVLLSWYLDKLIASGNLDLAEKVVSLVEVVANTISGRERHGGQTVQPDSPPTRRPGVLTLYAADPAMERRCAIGFKQRVDVSPNIFSFFCLAAEKYRPDETTQVKVSDLAVKMGWRQAWRNAKKNPLVRNRFCRNKARPLASEVRDRLFRAGVRDATIKVRLQNERFDVLLPGVKSFAQVNPSVSPEIQQRPPLKDASQLPTP